MIFSDRVELLLNFSDNRLEQFSVNKPQELVLKQVAKFREALKFRKKAQQNFYRQVLPAAKMLYITLIAPIAARLEQRQVDTLIVVPDSQLRTIPFAALYDDVKKVFLIEKYALAITPGLILTQAPKTFERDINLLMGGLSEKRSGFYALPNALKPIQAIENQEICPKIVFTALKNQQFQTQRLADNLKQVAYNLIYFSTHAQFDKNSTKSFVLTYDEKLSLDHLENLIRSTQFRDVPVELLVLSACETASGERAALGLAGIAVKTGAISAVGSLWKVADESTARLMESFFRELCDNPTLSKAKAFQNAQNKLLSEYKEYPFYWAPFLLIGNWF
jgi:CHAT domain-containing protein